MRAVILVIGMMVGMSVALAQTYDKPTVVEANAKRVPLNEWFVYEDDMTTKFYKGGMDHIGEYSAIIINETDGFIGEQESVRDSDSTYEMEGFDEYYAQDWYLSDGTTLTVTYKGEYGIIMVYPTEE